MTLASPRSDEYHPFYAGYVSRVADVRPLTELAAQRQRFNDFLSAVAEERSRHRYAPGKWTVKDLVGHLTDAERIFAYRLLRIGRGDATPLPGWEENDYVRTAAAETRPFQSLVAEWSVTRDATIALAEGMPEEAWARRGTANDTPVTARALLYIIIGHVEHHRAILQERYGIGR